jgi:cell division protease FtsH
VPPNYGAPPGWTPATTPRGTSWESGSRPYGQHGSGQGGQSGQYGSGQSGQSGQYGPGPSSWGSPGGQHAAPEDKLSSGRRNAPDAEQPSGGSFTSPGDGAPNPYGDPDGRRPDGRAES